MPSQCPRMQLQGGVQKPQAKQRLHTHLRPPQNKDTRLFRQGLYQNALARSPCEGRRVGLCGSKPKPAQPGTPCAQGKLPAVAQDGTQQALRVQAAGLHDVQARAVRLAPLLEHRPRDAWEWRRGVRGVSCGVDPGVKVLGCLSTSMGVRQDNAPKQPTHPSPRRRNGSTPVAIPKPAL